MRGTSRKPLLACAFALAIALPGCGGGNSGSIPPDEANQLLTVLSAVRDNAQHGDCVLARQEAAEFVNQVNQLPDSVDPDVASQLTKAGQNLEELAKSPDQCTQTGASGITGVDTSTTSTSTTAATTASTTTTTTTTESSTTQEPTQPQGGGNVQQQTPPSNQNPGGGGNVTPTPTPSGGLQPPSGGVTPGGGGGNSGG